MDTTLRDPLVGQLLDGRYRVESRIARGGMASVYVAVDTRLDRTVAVKVMHAGLAADQDFVARFIREAKSAARLSHPNVVAVFDQGTDAAAAGGSVWLAMEYVEGRTLRDLMRQRGALSPREALDVLEPVLAALGAAHNAGLVHRDVKPENILLADDGRVKVADFGLARAVSATTSATATQGLLIGTVAYLAPEQVERGVADPRSDVYAAGIVLFEMLTGAKPYEGESAIQVAYRHVHDDVPPPSSRRAGLPPEVDAIVVRATSRDPDLRPVDASRLLAELVALRRALPAEALDRHGAGGATDVTVVLRDGRPGPAQAAPQPEQLTMVVPRAASRQAAGAHEVAAGPHHMVAADPHVQTAAAPRRRHRGRGLIALLVVLLLASGLGVAGWYLGAGPGAKVPTPSLLRLTHDDAAAKAADAGLRAVFATTGRYDEQVPEGRVLDTTPTPGAQIRKGGTVTAVLSLGPERYDVPKLAGSTQAEAAKALADRKLVLAGHPESRYDDTAPAGIVLSSTPEAGASVKRGTPVALVLSKGPPPIPVVDYSGKDADVAIKAMRGAGLKVTRTESFSETVPSGQVISQQPASGTLIKGKTVALVVSKGPPLVAVPEVRDKTRKDAIRLLTAAGFTVATHGTRIIDRVFAQSVSGGDLAPKGSTITITTI